MAGKGRIINTPKREDDPDDETSYASTVDDKGLAFRQKFGRENRLPEYAATADAEVMRRRINKQRGYDYSEQQAQEDRRNQQIPEPHARGGKVKVKAKMSVAGGKPKTRMDKKSRSKK